MTDFDTCSCPERPIKCPACCLASWQGHQCDGSTRCDLTNPRNPDPDPREVRAGEPEHEGDAA